MNISIVLNELLVSCLVLLSPTALDYPSLVLSEDTQDRDNQPEPMEGTPNDGAEVVLSADDWSSIREAYEACRHAAVPDEDGYHAHNPGQGWKISYDGIGFDVAPEELEWTWGLQLVGIGFTGDMRLPVQSASPIAVGGRVTYEWGDMLDEWFINDTRGLEHGYTLHRRPVQVDEGEGGPLFLDVAVLGDLYPTVDLDGRGLRFLDSANTSIVTYSGLIVVDADGRDLRAGFEIIGGRVRLFVHETHARYPITIDPIAQRAFLKASNTDPHDIFGFSVAGL